jgi:DNA invertase Pin-like site-specific DNA recombinase
LSVSKFCSHVIGYASLSKSPRTGLRDFQWLRNYTMKIPALVELLAEEVHPSSLNRPMWNEVLTSIEGGHVKLLIVPSLFHIAACDIGAMSDVLAFLTMHGVHLKSLKEGIDSRRQTRSEIMMTFKQSVLSIVRAEVPDERS